MYRHELRLCCASASANSSTNSQNVSTRRETARGWAPPRIWRATSGHVNQIVIEHDYTNLDAFRKERAAFHDNPGSVGEVLARLSELAVPGTATEFEFDGVELGDAAE